MGRGREFYNDSSYLRREGVENGQMVCVCVCGVYVKSQRVNVSECLPSLSQMSFHHFMVTRFRTTAVNFNQTCLSATIPKSWTVSYNYGTLFYFEKRSSFFKCCRWFVEMETWCANSWAITTAIHCLAMTEVWKITFQLFQ